jgi:hypothetical protein
LAIMKSNRAAYLCRCGGSNVQAGRPSVFRDHPEAIAETLAVLEPLTFSLEELRCQYPDRPSPGSPV